MKKVYHLATLFTLLLISTVSLKAAHLVGGDISYICLGNNQYQIKLRIYRDCGSGGANFDANAAITIYETFGGVLVRNLSVAKGATVAVSNNPNNDPCLNIPSNLCTEYTEYISSAITLPPVSGGYTITHQRCCRNGSISNIPTPGDWGNTYTIHIPNMDTTCNSSAEIQGIAPSIICLGENLNIPISAIDADGDSLFFELCTILHGGGQSGGSGCNAIVPNPACLPPYTSIPFNAPYSFSNPMPASPSFGIDPQTGVLFGKPNAVGQFVLGICISDYKSTGELNSTVRLDYQFNVVNCGQPIAEMETPVTNPTMLCNGLTVDFKSLSSGATSQEWHFGNPVLGTSTATNPSFTFPGPGMYPVTLIINPGQSCGDSIQYIFNVSNQVDVDLVYTGIPCFEVQGLMFSPVGVYPANATFTWDFGPLANIQVSQLQFPPAITWSAPGLHQIALTVNWGACSKTFLDTIEISSLSLSVSAGPDQEVLPNQDVFLNASGGVKYVWSANLPVSFSNPLDPQATTRPQYDTTTYYVVVTDAFGCTGIDSMQVFVLRKGQEDVMNVITPNNDGKNDVLDLGNIIGNDDCNLSVIDRWGREVFQQDHYSNNWNGTSNGGQELPDGTYYFIVQFNNAIRYKGPVTILRN